MNQIHDNNTSTLAITTSKKKSENNSNRKSSQDNSDLQSSSSIRSPSISSRSSHSSTNRNPIKRRKLTKCERRIKRIQKKIYLFLESNYVIAFMTILTIWILFADNIRELATDKNGDIYIYDVNFACLIIFWLELTLLTLCKPRYFLSFYFWLDLISTISIIFDIGWISNQILYQYSSEWDTEAAHSNKKFVQSSQFGSQASKLLQIIILFRLVRIIKLYRHAQQVLSIDKNIFIQEFEELQLLDENEKAADGKARKSLFGSVDASISGKNPKTAENQQHLNHGHDSSTTKIDLNNENSQNHVSIEKINRNDINNEIETKQKFDSQSNGNEEINTKNNLDLQQEAKVGNTDSKNNKNAQGMDNVTLNQIPSTDKKIQKTEEYVVKETNVSKKLTELTIKRVFLLVLAILISIPVFTVDTYASIYSTEQGGLDSMTTYYFDNSMAAFSISLNSYANYHQNLRNPLIAVNINGNQDEWTSSGKAENDYRETDKYYYVHTSSQGYVIAYSVFSLEYDAMVNAALGIARTVFVTIVLAISVYYFSKDANDLVLSPIETMLQKVNRISKNPLEAAQIEENEGLALEILQKKGDKQALKSREKEKTYETVILEKTIIKIGALLALGFGEAGSEIIAQNMAKSGDVDPMIPGKKVLGIFGFCDIRNFTDATEILQENVMVFVNEIAEIVHGTVDYFSGSANKNIGDAFLLVWKFPKDQVIVESETKSGTILRLNESIIVNQIADMALLAFLKIIASINRSKKLTKYRHDPGLNRRIPNYSVKMGFGLHVGWAIEGAIGSEFKVDASYLSPNVNMASRLEAATKQFGVPLLLSGAIYKIFSPETKKQVRMIDRVTVKGSNEPVDIYTCDVDYSKLKINDSAIDLSGLPQNQKKRYKVLARLRRNELKEKALNGKFKVSQLFFNDPDILTMRESFTSEFYGIFNEGLMQYLAGNWSKAKQILEKTYSMILDYKDGPTNTLLSVMKEYGYIAPDDWKGYRELTEKQPLMMTIINQKQIYFLEQHQQDEKVIKIWTFTYQIRKN